MKQHEITLSQLPLNKKGYIKKLNCSETIRRRLLDLGFVENACITPVFESPSSEPRAFAIRGTLIALRKEDTSQIYIGI